MIAGELAGFRVDQIDRPTRFFPVDCTPIDTRKLGRYHQWIGETERIPERVC